MTATLTSAPPRFRYVPTFHSSAGQDCIDLAEHAGLILDPWQRDVVIDGLGEKRGGGWAATEVDLLVPRQNGKGGILEAVELFHLFLVPETRLITHTAHRFDTCLDHFRRVRQLVEATPDLLELVDDSGRTRSDGMPSGIKDSNGKESIVLKDRTILAFKAREKGSGRGFPGDFIAFDEAFYLGDLTGLVSSLSAGAAPQLWFTSSHPLPASVSDALRKIMRKGRRLATEGGDAKTVYIEYGCADDADINDPASLDQANPGRAVGRLNDDILEVERELYDEAGLKRERFGIVPLDTDTTQWELFNEDAWNAGKVPATPDWLTGPHTYAIEVTEKRDRYWIAAAGLHGDRIGTETGDSGAYDETAVLGRLVELHRKGKGMVIDERSPARTLIRPLHDLFDIEVTVVTTREYAAAGESYFDAHKADLAHSDQDPDLDASAAAAVSKPYSGGWIIQRTPESGCVIAHALARWGHLEIAEPEENPGYYGSED